MTPLMFLILAFLTVLILLPFGGGAALYGKRGGRIVAMGLLVVSLQALAIAFFLMDLNSGMSVSWLYCGGFVVLGLAICSVTYQQHRSKSALWLALAFTAFVLLLHFAELTPAKAFANLHRELGPGMSVEKMRSAVNRRSSAPSHFTISDDLTRVDDAANGRLMVKADWHPLRSDPWFVLISFSDGRVISSETNLTPISEETYLHVLAILVGVAFLFSRRVSLRRSAQKTRQTPSPVPAHGIEVAPVAQQLRLVRQNYLQVFPPRRHAQDWRKGMVASAAKNIRETSFFHDRSTDPPEAATHEPSQA